LIWSLLGGSTSVYPPAPSGLDRICGSALACAPRSRRWEECCRRRPGVTRAGSRLHPFVGVRAPLPLAEAAGARPREAVQDRVPATAVLGGEAAVAAGVGIVSSCPEAAAAGLSTPLMLHAKANPLGWCSLDGAAESKMHSWMVAKAVGD
jgi:hypothetical protein